MEIKRYIEEYKKHCPEKFFKWLSRGRVLEVRFLSDKYGAKFNDWNLINHLSEGLMLEKRFSSLFISEFKQLKAILLYRINGIPLTKLYNIFISVNPRRKVYVRANNGLLYKSYYGGIAGTSHIQTILCDIEHTGKREDNATEAMLEECIQGAEYLVKLHDIKDYYINISGNGVHLWFQLDKAIDLPIPKILENKKTKYNLKEEPIYSLIKTYNRFIEKLEKDLKAYNPKLKVDEGAKDIARIARHPGSWNVKAGKLERAVGTVINNSNLIKYNYINFMAAKPTIDKNYKKVKIKSKNNRYTQLNIVESPLVQLLLSGMLPSTLSRNHYLEQSLARLLKDNEIELHEIQDLVNAIDLIQGKAIQVDPDYLDGDEPFNPETINCYCYACKIALVYPIMEDMPEIEDGFITDNHYRLLNSYSNESLKVMRIDKIIEKPNSYFALKTLIRNLVDSHERSSVFSTIKLLMQDDWEYLDKNKIVRQILNKTRRRL